MATNRFASIIAQGRKVLAEGAVTSKVDIFAAIEAERAIADSFGGAPAMAASLAAEKEQAEHFETVEAFMNHLDAHVADRLAKGAALPKA